MGRLSQNFLTTPHRGTQFKHRTGFSKAKELQIKNTRTSIEQASINAKDIERPSLQTYLQTVLSRPLIKIQLFILFGIGCLVAYLFLEYVMK